MCLDGVEYAVVFELIEIGNVVLLSLAAALFAAVARDEAAALAEVDDVELTVSGTAAALCRARSIGEVLKLLCGDECASSPSERSP